MTYCIKDQPAELSLVNTRVIDSTSSVNGRQFRLNIGLPLMPAPPTGYRVFYVLDGNGYSASAIEAVRNNMNAPDVLVVGIGYPETEDFIAASLRRHGPLDTPWAVNVPRFIQAVARERMFDLTLPVTQDWIRRLATPVLPSDPSGFGGVDALLDTIERDIKPRIDEFGSIDHTRSALFGHSAGGHAVLHALFTRPTMFQTFVAASTAIWLSDRAVLANEGTFAQIVERGDAAPRVLVTMGSEESSMPRGFPPEFSTDEVRAVIKSANMVDDSRHLVERLQRIRGGPGFEVADYALFPEQQHGISVWPALGRAIDFAFQR